MIGIWNDLTISDAATTGFVLVTNFVKKNGHPAVIILTARQWLNTLDILDRFGLDGLAMSDYGLRLMAEQLLELTEDGCDYSLRLPYSGQAPLLVTRFELYEWYKRYTEGSLDLTYPSGGPGVLAMSETG